MLCSVLPVGQRHGREKNSALASGLCVCGQARRRSRHGPACPVAHHRVHYTAAAYPPNSMTELKLVLDSVRGSVLLPCRGLRLGGVRACF